MQDHRDLGDPHSLQRGLDHHLARKLHAGRTEPHPLVSVFRKCPEATVRIADGSVEEDPADARQDRIANVLVGPRHRTGLDAAKESVADHKVIALPKPGDEWRDRGEVIAGVGVAMTTKRPCAASMPPMR